MIIIKKKVIQQTFIEFHLPKERILMKIRKDAATAALLMLLAAPVGAQAGGFYVGASIGKSHC